MAQPENTARLIYWDLEVDDDGYRTYTARYLVRLPLDRDSLTFSSLYGPYYASNEPQGFAVNISGLPRWGDFWQQGNDSDTGVVCVARKKVTPYEQKNDPHEYFVVECYFTNKPSGGNGGGTSPDTLDYPRFSGGYTSGRIEAQKTYDGTPILNSANQPIKGPKVEFDDNQPTIVIEQASTVLQLYELSQLKNKLNGFAPIWGLGTTDGSNGDGTRIVKCQSITWQEVKLPMSPLGRYFVRRFEFEVGYKFDPDDILDEGNQVWDGQWNTAVDPPVWNENAPQTNFVRATDPAGNMLTVQLDGTGSRLPDTTLDENMVMIPLIDSGPGAVQYYGEFSQDDLVALGINPLDFLLTQNYWV